MGSVDIDRLVAIRALLAHGYLDDPMTRWIFADEATRLNTSAAWYGLFAERYLRGQGRCSTIVEDGQLVAAALL